MSCGTTATIEKAAPFGFQHLVQPQAWLWATLPSMRTLTGRSVQSQTSVPPAKLGLPGLTPPSMAGCIDIPVVICSLLPLLPKAVDPAPELPCPLRVRSGHAASPPRNLALLL